MNALKRFSILSFCLLTACAPPRPAEEAPINKVIPLKERQAQTNTVHAWEIRGAMAAKSKGKGWQATLNWIQEGPNNYQIRLVGPLGGGSVLINKQGSTVTFQDGKKRSSSSSADELLMKETGIRLPVGNLYYWVRGLPAPGTSGASQHDSYNHLTHLNQSGYAIDFMKYTSVNGLDLPSLIRIEGHGIMAKVIIKQWRI